MQKSLENAREGLTEHFNKEMESILNANSKLDKYWILGKVRFPKEMGGSVGRVFLQACLEIPQIVKDSFVYEVDNRAGSKSLLWVMNPDNSLQLPTLNKTIQAKMTA